MTIGKVETGGDIHITTAQIYSADSSNDGIVDLSGEKLTITATKGIVTDSVLLETSVKNFTANAGSGVNLSNYGGLSVDDINTGSGVQ